MQAGWGHEPTEEERLRALLRRLVVSADADRRAIERDLHDGIQQHLVALAVAVQLADQGAGADRARTAGLQDLARDVQNALDEAALLAQRIYPATLEADGLAVLLRSAAARSGRHASVDVVAGADVPAEAAVTVYLCWLDALARAGGERRASIEVRERDGALDFEVHADGARPEERADWLRDRVEALGGRVASEPDAAGGVKIVGSLPLSR